MKCSSRWFFIAIAAIALGVSLLGLPDSTPLSLSSATFHPKTDRAAPPPANASWQVTLMGARW